MVRRIIIIIGIVVVVVGIISVLAYPSVLRSLKQAFRAAPLPSPQATFLAVPKEPGFTVFRMGVVPKDFPREFLPPSEASLASGGPPVLYGLSARRGVSAGGETYTTVSFETAMSLEMLRLWYVQQFAAKEWVMQSEHPGVNQVSLRATKDLRFSLVVTLQDAQPARRKVNLVYSVKPL